MRKTLLSNAISAALKGAPDPLSGYEAEIMRRQLARARELVDSGRLACIIITERLDDAGKQVRSTPCGDPNLVLQTAMHIVDRATRGADDVRQAESVVPLP